MIHTAFNHDFSRFAENADVERRTIEALGAALAGSNRGARGLSRDRRGRRPDGQDRRRDGSPPQLPVVSKSGAEVAEHFGWFAMFAGLDALASSAKPQQQSGWHPSEPGLISDLDREAYFAA